MAARTLTPDNYRYGFNGQEKDDEVSGAGNTNTAAYWEYDTRLGRRWNLDPKSVAFWSPYSVFYDMPTLFVDKDGDCPWFLIPALLISSIAVAPTNNHQQDAIDLKAARRNQDIQVAALFLGPAVDKVVSVSTKVASNVTAKIIQTTEQQIAKYTEQQVAKQVGENAVREGTKGVVEDIVPGEFVKKNLARLEQKLGDKVGKGQLPFEKGKAGVQEAIQIVENTIESKSVQTEAFVPKSGGEAVKDIFSKETGFTVRVNAKTNEFVTLIDEATPAVQNALKKVAPVAKKQ